MMLPVGVLAACYAVVMRFPGNRVLRPYTYLWVLVLSLSGLSYLRDGYAALFMVTLPHFWALARSWRESAGFSALGTLGTLAGSMMRAGWSADFFSSNAISTLIVYSASVLIGTWVHQVVQESHERARLIGELERAQAELSQAHQRQGAADERERMAREIHDTLAQGFASIVVLAEAARAGLGSAPQCSEQQLRSIEATARENLAEARELVGTAREPGRPAAGVGFDVGRPPGFGLDGMRRRLAELGGELTVTSSPGDGTRVLAVIPL